MAIDFANEIRDLRTTMASVREVSDLDRLRETISDLETQASDPALWEDQERAQQVTSGLSRTKAELERVTGMEARIDDLEVLVEMGEEEHDQATLDEAARELATIRKAVGELEVRTLLSGEYDERAAVVTIRAGAGARAGSRTLATGHDSRSWLRRQRTPASMNSSMSPSKTFSGLPTSCSVRRSLTIW